MVPSQDSTGNVYYQLRTVQHLPKSEAAEIQLKTHGFTSYRNFGLKHM